MTENIAFSHLAFDINKDFQVLLYSLLLNSDYSD